MGEKKTKAKGRALCLALAAALALALPARGEERDVKLTGANGWGEYVSSLCFAGETLYALGNSGLYALAPRADAFETVLDMSEAALYRGLTEAPEDPEQAALWRSAASILASDGETVLAVQPWSGQVLRLEGGELRALLDLPGGLLEMRDDPLARREVRGAVCEGGTLFLLLGTDTWDESEKTELAAVDLRTGEARACSPERVAGIAPGAPGKLLLLSSGEKDCTLSLYDIAADAVETTLARFDPQDTLAATAWDAALGEAVLYRNGRIVRAGEPDTALAYAPLTFPRMSQPAACSASGRYAVTDGECVYLRDLSTGEPANKTELILSGDLNQALIRAFSIENPDIAVNAGFSAEAATAAMLAGDGQIDLLCLSVPDGPFSEYASRGYLAEIESEALRAYAASLYPAIADSVTRGGKLLGMPMDLFPNCWTIDETLWTAAGMGDAPRTYADVFDDIALWLNEKAEDYPDLALSDLQQTDLASVARMIVRQYVLEREAAGEAVEFDTPDFREAMTLLVERGDLLSEEHEQWGMPILYDYYIDFGVAQLDSDRAVMMAPPSVTGAQAGMTASVRVLAVSASSRHKEEAERFIAWIVDHLPDKTRYEMDPALTEPVEREGYAEDAARLNERLAALEAQAEKAAEPGTLEEEIAKAKRDIEANERFRYALSPESIAIYRETAKDLRVPWNSLLAVSGVNAALGGVIDPLCADGLTADELDALVAQLDRVSSMVAEEAK